MITQDRVQKMNRNEPENEAGKLLKMRSCGKNKAKNKPGHLVENTERQKSRDSVWFSCTGVAERGGGCFARRVLLMRAVEFIVS